MLPVPTLLAALLLLAPDAGATRAPVSRASLCAEASAVVVAEVTTLEGRWRAGEPGGIETVVSVAITDTMRGAPPASVSFVVPGGTFGGVTELISEAPRFRTDARYVLLLAPAGPTWRLVGGVDGMALVPWGEGELERALARLGACRA